MLRALAESGRVSNLPTVWTNVLAGVALAGWPGTIGPLVFALATLTLFYLGGMVLNDVMDARWDREHKPGRPIAEGRLSYALALWVAVGALAGGVALAATRASADRPASLLLAGGLAGAIVLYDWLHKRSAWTVLLMAACRALVYPLSASLVAPEPAHTVWPASAAIAAYTLLLTLGARREDEPGGRVSGVVAWLVPAPWLLAALVYGPASPAWVIPAAAALLAWSCKAALDATRGRVRGGVLSWLAGLCLADTLLLTLLDRPGLAGAALAGWLITVLAHRRIPGT